MDENIFLTELKKYGIKNEIPNISEKNARFLRDIISLSKSKNILEIGTANWYSTIQFALEIKKICGKVSTIEFSLKSYNDALENFKKAELNDYIEALYGNAIDIIPTLKKKYDFIFIDGMKKRSLDFFLLAEKKIKKWGIIIIDDVIKFKNKMENLYEYLEKENKVYHILPIDEDDGIMMILNR
jgi:predicted O-methyltransferase YrrM